MALKDLVISGREAELMKRNEVLSALIRARTALKTDQADRALKAVRDAIKMVDPGGALEMEMRGGLSSSQRQGDRT